MSRSKQQPERIVLVDLQCTALVRFIRTLRKHVEEEGKQRLRRKLFRTFWER